MTPPQPKAAELRSPSPIGTFGRRGSAYQASEGSDHAAQSPPLATPSSAVSTSRSQEIEQISDSPRVRGKRRTLRDVEPELPRTPSRLRVDAPSANTASFPSPARPSRSDDGGDGSEDERRQSTQQSSRDSSYDVVAVAPAGYGRGERGGYQSPVPVKRTTSPEIREAREQWRTQQDRSFQQRENVGCQPSSSRTMLDGGGRLSSPSRPPGLAPAVSLSLAGTPQQSRHAESSPGRQALLLQPSAPGGRERLIRSPRLVPEERESRALSLPERPEAIPVHASAHRSSLTFLNPHQNTPSPVDMGGGTIRPSRSRRRDRVQSAPHGRLLAATELHGMPSRSSRHLRHASSTAHVNAVPHRRSGSLYTTARLSQVGDQEALDIVARQRRLSTAYSIAIAALEPRLPPSDVSLSRPHSPLSVHKGARLPQDGGGSIRVPAKRGSLRFVAHRTMLPYRIAAPLLLTLFLDFNALFVLGELGSFPGSDAGARQQAAWWIAFGIYAAATSLHIALVCWNFFRSYALQKDERGALAVQEYLSYYGRIILMLRSPSLHAFVRHVDAMAGRKQRLIEQSFRWSQNWPFAVLEIPRVAILVVTVVLYMPQGTSNSGNAHLRDPFFFDQSTGAISRYTRGVLLANIAFMTCAVISVLIALVIPRHYGRSAVHTGSGPLLLRKHPNDQYGRPLPADPSGASSLEYEAALQDSSTLRPRGAERSWRTKTEDRVRYALLHYGDQSHYGQGVGLMTDQLTDEEVRTVQDDIGTFDRFESAQRLAQPSGDFSRPPEMQQVIADTTQQNAVRPEDGLRRPVSGFSLVQPPSQPLTPATALTIPPTSDEADMICTAESPAVPFPISESAQAASHVDLLDATIREEAEVAHTSVSMQAINGASSSQAPPREANEGPSSALPQAASSDPARHYIEGEAFEMLADDVPSNGNARPSNAGLRGTLGVLGLGRIRTHSDSDDASVTPHASPALHAEKEGFWTNWFGSKGRSRKISSPDRDLELKGQATPPLAAVSAVTLEGIPSEAAQVSDARGDISVAGGAQSGEPTGNGVGNAVSHTGSPISRSQDSVEEYHVSSNSLEQQPQSSTPPLNGNARHPAVSELAHAERSLESPAPSAADSELTRTSSEDSEEMRLWATFPEQSRRHPPGLIALEFQQRRLEEEENLRRRQQEQQRQRQQGYMSGALGSGAPDELARQTQFAGGAATGLGGPGAQVLGSDAEETEMVPSAAFSKHLYGRSPSEGGLMAIREESLGGSSVTTHNTSASLEILASLSHSSPQQRDRDRFRSNRASLDASVSADRSLRSGSDSPLRPRDSMDEPL